MPTTIRGAVRWLAPLALVVTAGLTALPSSAHSTDGLDDVRAAAVRFHSVAQAQKAGYQDNALPCFDDPAGGMGEHLINGALVGDGGALDAGHPEALVYEVRDGSWKLVAVEYVVLFSDAPYPGPAPTLLGQSLAPNPGLGLWKLHAWVFRSNPLGVFNDWNPEVTACP